MVFKLRRVGYSVDLKTTIVISNHNDNVNINEDS